MLLWFSLLRLNEDEMAKPAQKQKNLLEVKSMWYVMQVTTGSESKIQLQCQRMIPKEFLTECFIPYYEEKKRFQGRWVVQKKIMFPGYVFVVTDAL